MASGNPFRKVAPGQALEIPAEAYNGMIDAALVERARRTSFAGKSGPLIPFGEIMLVQNESEADISRFGVLGLDDAIIHPALNAAEFASKPAMIGVTPEAHHRGKFGVALEPIAQHSIGRMCVGGLCTGYVELLSPDEDPDEFADVKAGETAWLKGSAAGSARILWCEPKIDRPESAIAWCLFVIGGGTSPGGTFNVKVYIDGGTAGSESTNCSWTYTVKTLNGKTIGTLLAPEKVRFTNVPYAETPDGAIGAAYFSSDGTLHLWDANEEALLVDCDASEPSGIDGGAL